jgi:beta-hydroxylase
VPVPFMFDDTFIHSAENATDINRIILFCLSNGR